MKIRVKQVAKYLINMVALLIMLPISLPIRIVSPEGRPSAIFSFASEFLSLIPGIPGGLLRRGFYRVVFSDCAGDVTIGFGTIFSMRGTSIGEDTYIGPYCTVGLARIGHNVLIGTNVDVLGSPSLHNFDDITKPIKKQGGDISVLEIGAGSWIGNGVTLLADVGNECVVGAASVVTKPCEDWGIYVGNPAHLLRDRRTIKT